MKTSDLRVGNVVADANLSIFKICMLGGHLGGDTIIGRSVINPCWCQTGELFPIEITEQWLINLGFRKDEKIDYKWYLGDWLAYDIDDKCIRVADSWEFGKRKYVHELQNLVFAITGKELELRTDVKL